MLLRSSIQAAAKVFLKISKAGGCAAGEPLNGALKGREVLSIPFRYAIPPPYPQAAATVIPCGQALCNLTSVFPTKVGNAIMG